MIPSISDEIFFSEKIAELGTLNEADGDIFCLNAGKELVVCKQARPYGWLSDVSLAMSRARVSPAAHIHARDEDVARLFFQFLQRNVHLVTSSHAKAVLTFYQYWCNRFTKGGEIDKLVNLLDPILIKCDEKEAAAYTRTLAKKLIKQESWSELKTLLENFLATQDVDAQFHFIGHLFRDYSSKMIADLLCKTMLSLTSFCSLQPIELPVVQQLQTRSQSLRALSVVLKADTVSAELLSQIGLCTNLHSLGLFGAEVYHRALFSLQHISGLSQLTKLTLSSVFADDGETASLRNFPQLHTLSLFNTPFTYLPSQLTELQCSLDVDYLNLRLSSILALTSIETLSVTPRDASLNEGLHLLKRFLQMPRLRRLVIAQEQFAIINGTLRLQHSDNLQDL